MAYHVFAVGAELTSPPTQYMFVPVTAHDWEYGSGYLVVGANAENPDAPEKVATYVFRSDVDCEAHATYHVEEISAEKHEPPSTARYARFGSASVDHVPIPDALSGAYAATAFPTVPGPVPTNAMHTMYASATVHWLSPPYPV